MTFGLADNPTQFIDGIGWSGAAAAVEGAATATNAHLLACWQTGNSFSVLLSGTPSSYQLEAIAKSIMGTGLTQGTYTTFEVLDGVTLGSGFTTSGEGGVIASAPAPPSVDVVRFTKVIASALVQQGVTRTIVMTFGSGRRRTLAVIALGAEGVSSNASLFLASALATAMAVPQTAVSVEQFKAL